MRRLPSPQKKPRVRWQSLLVPAPGPGWPPTYLLSLLGVPYKRSHARGLGDWPPRLAGVTFQEPVRAAACQPPTLPFPDDAPRVETRAFRFSVDVCVTPASCRDPAFPQDRVLRCRDRRVLTSFPGRRGPSPVLGIRAPQAGGGGRGHGDGRGRNAGGRAGPGERPRARSSVGSLGRGAGVFQVERRGAAAQEGGMARA